jgi:hypothetical protein
MSQPPNTNNPAALVNFIFRQLPDDVVDELKSAQHGGPHETVVSVIGGSAVAAGQDTVTIGVVENHAEASSLPLPHGVGKGGYSVMVGDAIFEASAQAPEGSEVDAAANTFLALSAADFIILFGSTDDKRQANDASATSELDYIALNINGWSPEGGTVVIELQHPDHHARPDEGYQQPEGNYAAVIATADAHGPSSVLTAAQTFSLAVENQFSFVTALSVVAV